MKTMTFKSLRLLLSTALVSSSIPGGWAAVYEESIRSATFDKGNLFSQQRIGGTVADAKGVPLTGASISIKGTDAATVTDAAGNFSISATNGQVLIVSFVGYETQEISVGDETTFAITMQASSGGLEEVVVTALGIKKERKQIGYAVQEVKGETLQKAVAPNVLESLTGKVAGLTITNSNDFFSDPGIYLRGKKPLIVIDGVPNPNTDMWNISPDDIENISVLKAAAASALYGSLGLNGAVQITLKSGSGAARGTTVISANSSTNFQGGFIRVPEIQTQYGPGNAGRYAFGTGSAGGGGINDFDYSIWGPKFDGRLLPQYDSPIDPETGERVPTPWISRGENNLANFMETGIVSNNNVTVQANGERGTFIVSNTYMYSKASVPGAKLDNNIVRLRGLLNLSDWVSLDGSLQYNYEFASNRPRSNYGPHSPIYTLAIWGGAHFDVRDFEHNYWVPGREGVQQYFVENWRYNNPYVMAYERRHPFTRNDVLGYLKINLKLHEKIDAFVRTNLNTNSTTTEEQIAVDIYDYDIPDRGGRYRYNDDYLFDSNTDFLVNYNDSFFGDQFTLGATLGGNQRFLASRVAAASTTQLVVPGIFKLSNSVDQVTPTSSKYKKAVYSAYASVDLAYDNWLFLGVTGRVDRSSTLPKDNDTYFYPSVSLSAVISDIITLPKAVNFLKVRASYAKVGGDMDFYEAVNSYSTGERYRLLPIASYPEVLDNPNLSPAFNTSYEYGVEANFFSNRFGFDFSYYENNYGPEIFVQRFSQTSGYEGIRLNGRTTQRKGYDFSIRVAPVRNDRFSWDAMINFDAGKDYLTSLPDLPDGTPQEREGRTRVGDRLDDYWYSEWERSPDGQLIILPSGLPKRTDFQYNQGSTQANFTTSINNSLNYKNVSLSFLLDGRFGGITYDAYERDLWRSGSHPDAIHPERELSNIAYATGGDARTMQIPGVKVVSGEATFDPEGNLLSDTRVFEPSDYKVEYQSWATSYKAAWENVLIEKTFVKLREVILTYRVPQKLLEKTFFNGASVSLVGRNLFYWTKNHTYGDMDTYTMSTGDTGLQFPSQRTYGFNLNFNF